MSWGVALRNAVGLGLGGIPSLLNAPPYAKLAFNFLSGELDSRITFSRTSNATLIGSDGTLQYAPHNLLTYSEQFDNAVWSKSDTTVLANNTTAPDGTQTADKLVENTATAFHVAAAYAGSFTPGMVGTVSCYLKAAERFVARLQTDAAAGFGYADFNLSTGSVTNITGICSSATATPVGDGWYRCSIVCTATGTGALGAKIIINAASYTGDGTSGLHVWGAQLNVGALQPYYSTTVKNLLGYTQEFDNATWSKSNSTITADVTAAPDGSVTADKLVEDTVTTGHYITPGSSPALVVGQVVTYSAYAKAAERTFLQLIVTSVGPASANLVAGFDLTTGTAGTPSAGSTSSTVSVGNGWYRCSITVPVATAGTPTRQIRVAQNSSSTPSSYTGDGTSGIYVWGAQFSDSASLDPYVYNPAAAPSNTAYYGPRLDYDPVTLAAKGLLIEEQRTNQQLYSEDLSQWGAPTNATVSNNVAVAPDGFTTADKLVEDTATSTHFLSATSSTHSYVSGTLYTRSCFLKAAERFIVSVYLPAAAFPASSRQALFNLSTGTVYSVESGVTASIQAFGNGWYRCSITATANVTGSAHVGGSALIDNAGNGTYTGNGVSGALIWGAQMEVASFATSYIPTTTAAATRAADVASVTGANFSNWYNSVEGTMVAESTLAQYCPAGKFGQCVWQVDDGTSNNRMHVRNDATLTTNSFRSINVDGINAALTLGFALNVPVKTALAYKVNDFNGASNGSIGTADTSVNPPVVNALRLGQENSGLWLNGHIRSFKYYPTRLSNGQLQTLTK